MTSQSNLPEFSPRERAQYGEARAKDLAFNAVRELWRRRRAEGMKQIDIAQAIERQPATVSRNLGGPRNFTLRTLGEFVEALNGELEIIVRAVEDPLPTLSNYHAYAGYEPPIDFTKKDPSTRRPTELKPGSGSASLSTVSS